MDDAKRTMANQLERFQGLSETRWPLPSGVFCFSGEDRKALSRYINEYIAELEKSDQELKSRRPRQSDPPREWQTESPLQLATGALQQEETIIPTDSGDSADQPSTPLKMSRLTYLKRQNELFKELTGFHSWSELSSQQAAQDSRDQPLMTSLELYMAALDEKIYMSADHLRAMVGVRDKEVRDKYDELKKAGVSRRDLVELRDLYQLLWFEHSNLAHQRDQLEVEMSQLRYDHALQLAKVVRLQYATHALGRKLVDAQHWRMENNDLRIERDQLQRENEQLRAQNEALRAQEASSRQLLNSGFSSRGDAKGRDIETKITKLFDLALDLRAENLYTSALITSKPMGGGDAAASDKNPAAATTDSPIKYTASEQYAEQMRTILAGMSPEEQHSTLASKPPLELLEHAANLIDMGKLDADGRLSSIIEAFSQQYRAREQELLLQTASLDRERQIILARCEKLEGENAAISSDLAYLEQRTLSLVLMLKSVRATLDQQSSAEGQPAFASDEYAFNAPTPEPAARVRPESEAGEASRPEIEGGGLEILAEGSAPLGHPLLNDSELDALSALVGGPPVDKMKQRPKPKRRV